MIIFNFLKFDDIDFHKGLKLFKKAKPSLAVIELKKYVEHHPDNLEAHFTLAECYLQMDFPDEACKELEIVQRIDPGFDMGYYLMAIALSTKGSYKEALSELKKGERIDPENGNIRFEMGKGLLRAGFLIFPRSEAERSCRGSPAERASAERLVSCQACFVVSFMLYGLHRLSLGIVYDTVCCNAFQG